MPRRLTLQNVINPGNNDEMVVTRGDPPAPVNVPSGGDIFSGDTINGATDASATVAYVDTQTNAVDANVVSFSGAEPTVLDEVNWDEVTQVDEYYDGGTYDYSISTADDDIFTIVG